MASAFLPLAAATAAIALAGAVPLAHAEIYTCVDAKGRHLTADRPIIDCIDREQQQVSPNGIVVRKLGPSLTADERAAQEDRQKRDIEERSRLLDEKRRDRALLSRFPDRAAHDKERASAIATADEIATSGRKRLAELQAQRKKMDLELEFYKGDVKKASPKVRRQVEEIDTQIAGQQRFIQNQEGEKLRINSRFDEELTRLRPMWAHAGPASSASR